MLNVQYAFKEKYGLTPEEARMVKDLFGFQEIKCNLIFDIKMDGKFTRKARFVASGNTTNPPASLTYSSTFPAILSGFPSLLLLSTNLLYGNVILKTHT